MPEGHKATVHPKYRPDVDGLRAVAVLAVMGFHAFPRIVRGGFIGVDIFFVISGFLISTIIFANLERDTFSYLEFYNRRIRRIFPALLIVLTACFVFAWFALLADEFAELSKHIAGGAGFLSNFLLWKESGYFDTSAETKPLLHLWSLAIEEQFYVVWPLLLAFAWKKRWNLLVVTSIIGVLSFAVNVLQAQSNDVADFYSPITRFWELLVGGALAYIALKRPSVLATYHVVRSNLMSVAGLLMIAAGLKLISQDQPFPGWWALLPTIGTVLVIAAGADAWLNKLFLANPALVAVGLISYPLYLWHWPLLAFARVVFGPVAPITRIGLLGAAVVLAWLTYQLIEKPIRFGPRRRTKAIALITCSIVLAVIGYTTYQLGGIGSRSMIRESTFTPQVQKQFTSALWQFTSNRPCLKRFSFKEASSYPWWFCVVNKDASPTVLILGNSYANHLYPGLAAHPALSGQTILSIGVCSAEWVDSTTSRSTYRDPCSGTRQLHQMNFIDSLIERTGTIRFAILDGLPPKPSARYIAQLERRLEFFRAHGVTPIIFVPHVTPYYDTRSCFTRPFRRSTQSCTVDVSVRGRLTRAFAPLQEKISTSQPDVRFFDQNDYLCDRSRCSFIRNGIPVFRDEYHHYSVYGSTGVAEIFVDWAQRNVPQLLGGTDTTTRAGLPDAGASKARSFH